LITIVAQSTHTHTRACTRFPESDNFVCVSTDRHEINKRAFFSNKSRTPTRVSFVDGRHYVTGRGDVAMFDGLNDVDRRRVSSRSKLLKTSVRHQFNEFFKHSSLHGVRYIAQSDRPLHERYVGGGRLNVQRVFFSSSDGACSCSWGVFPLRTRNAAKRTFPTYRSDQKRDKTFENGSNQSLL